MHDIPDLVPGSVAAKVVARVWSGGPGTLVSAAPGAGKTTLVIECLRHLVLRAGMRVVVATPTREQAYGITERTVALMPPGWVEAPVAGAEGRLSPRAFATTRGLDPHRGGPGSVTVRTIESCRYGARLDADLMVVDEGYQSTFSALTSAAGQVPQLLVVGDSGQIGPVVPEDVSVLDRWGATPHHRAPDALAARPDFETLHLDTSYRLGADTCEVVSLMYPFEVRSGRPERTLFVDELPVPELSALDIGRVADLNDISMLSGAVARAVAASTGTRHDGDVDADLAMTDADVCVVVSRNSQVSLVRGMLDEAGHPGIMVGTANRLQGGQWSAVVAVDPLAGVASPGERDLDNGLLCVMVSRHTTHLTWVHATIADTVGMDALGRQVRDRLISKGTT